jgi:hypothetical protein
MNEVLNRSVEEQVRQDPDHRHRIGISAMRHEVAGYKLKRPEAEAPQEE